MLFRIDIASAESLYDNLGEYLIGIVKRRETVSFRTLNKGGKRAKKLEEFILEYVLMCDPPIRHDGDHYDMKIVEDLNDEMGGLRVYIDAEDDSTVKGEVFRQLQHKATSMRKAGQHDLILKTIDYVRKTYRT